VLHALAALKHHFFDRDRTLRRILWPPRRDFPE
jgi:cytochrome b561